MSVLPKTSRILGETKRMHSCVQQQSALAKTNTGVFQESGYLGRLHAGAAGCAARGARVVKQKDPQC